MGALRPRYPRLRVVPPSETTVLEVEAGWPRPAAGVDFAFRHLRCGRPVLWPTTTPIVVRAVGSDVDLGSDADPSSNAYLREVVHELARLTGLPISLGDPDRSSTVLRVPGEIRVLYATLDDPPTGTVAPMPFEPALGVGAALPDARGEHLVSGYAVIDPSRCAAAATPVIGVVRHELGHALGLHHANRLGHVMSRHGTATEWSRGDCAGLHRIGVGRGPSVSHV